MLIRFEYDNDTSIPHLHEDLEILYILSGRCAIMSSTRNYILGKEDFVVFNPYEHHELYPEHGTHILSAYFPLNILEQCELSSIDCCSVLHPEKKEYLQQIRVALAVLFKYYSNPSGYQNAQMLHQIFALFAVLKGQFEDERSSSSPLGYHNSLPIRSAIIYINQHYAEPLSLDKVASEVFLSSSQFSRLFQNKMNCTFSDYLRKLRLQKVTYYLAHTDYSITEIALLCGFSNVNTMILNFKELYLSTPGIYRKEHQKNYKDSSEKLLDFSSSLSFMNLLKHTSAEETTRPLMKKTQCSTDLFIDLSNDIGAVNLQHDQTISVGWAVNLLREDVRNAIRFALEYVPFQHLLFLGILDDIIDVYHEYPDGTPWYNYLYFDQILDFILETKAKPHLCLCFTPSLMIHGPKKQFGTSSVNLPDDLGKWSALIRDIMQHLLFRYGEEELNTWIFSPQQCLYASYNLFTMDAYLAYYEVTYRTIKEFLPDAVFIGPGFDTGFVSLDGPDDLIAFLSFCKKHNCLPNALSVQCFSADYSQKDRRDTESKIADGPHKLSGEPVPPSHDRDVLKNELLYIHKILEDQGMNHYPIMISSWNSTIWHGDPGNDTCFKAAYIVKNVLEIGNLVESIAYNHLTDYSENRMLNSTPFHGGYGLLNYWNIPKAGFYAFQFLSYLKKYGSRIVSKGDGYYIARTNDKKHIQIMLYHYCHYDFKNHIDYILSEEEQKNFDRYYSFEMNGTRSYHMHFKNFLPGTYQKRSLSISREHGSSYDTWQASGCPDYIDTVHKQHLTNSSTFGVLYDTLTIHNSEGITFSAVLDEHEVRLILIDKR